MTMSIFVNVYNLYNISFIVLRDREGVHLKPYHIILFNGL